MASTLRNTCILLAVCLSVSFFTGRAFAQADDAPPKSAPPFFLKLQPMDHWYWEIAFLCFIFVYIINIVWGSAQNEGLAIAWTSEMVKANGVLDRNFSMLGPGDTKAGEVLLKESMNEFKLWASGRRFCQSFLATFILKKRQDLAGLVLEMLASGKDVMDFEVTMNESCMQPVVLVVATPSIAKQLQKNMSDVESLTRRFEVDKARLAGWPAKGLVVLGEHSSTFYDLFPPHVVDLVFGPAAWQQMRRYFRSLHISSEYGPAPHKQVIRLSFNLPDLANVEAMQRLLTLTTLLVDLVGTYKLTPDQVKRAQEARAKWAAKSEEGKEDEEERQRRAEERKQRKLTEEKEKMKKMTPEQRTRYEEKKRKKQMKGMFRVKMM